MGVEVEVKEVKEVEEVVEVVDVVEAKVKEEEEEQEQAIPGGGYRTGPPPCSSPSPRFSSLSAQAGRHTWRHSPVCRCSRAPGAPPRTRWPRGRRGGRGPRRRRAGGALTPGRICRLCWESLRIPGTPPPPCARCGPWRRSPSCTGGIPPPPAGAPSSPPTWRAPSCSPRTWWPAVSW